MGLFDKPEVVILKESSDARKYLAQLEDLLKQIKPNSALANSINREIAVTKAGIVGEDAILFELKNSGMDLVVLHDLYMETEDGRGAQIDYLVVTPYVNVIIECKNLFGNIEINSKGDFIRSFCYEGRWIKEGIYSPITQNERHLTVFKDCRAADKHALSRFMMEKSFAQYNKSLVVLANPKTVVYDRYAPRSVKEKVIRGDQLISTLKVMRSDMKKSKKEMLVFAEKYLSFNREDRKEYIKKYVALESQSKMDPPLDEPPTEESPARSLVCPRCGKELVLRTARKGANAGEQFYGCSGFPNCRYIMNKP